MFNGLKGIFYKEYADLFHNKKSFISSVLIFCSLLTVRGVLSANTLNGDARLNVAYSNAFYTSIFVSFVGMITTLKYWKEKSMHTLDSLFATPIPFKVILISKALFSTLVGSFCAILTYIISTLVFLFATDVSIFSILYLLEILVFSFFLDFGYSLINGFAMWGMTTGASKAVQYLAYVVYIAGISGIIGADMTSGITSSVYATLTTVTIILNIIAFFCTCIIRKEKVVLLQEY